MLSQNESFWENFTFTFATPAITSSTYEQLRVVEKTLSTINMIVIVFGTLGNTLTLLLLMRKNVHKHSCMRYLAVLCFLDTCCLYTWNFSMIYSKFRRRKIEHEGPILCRFFAFYSYSILQTSSWVICAIGMDRLATVILSSANRLSKIVRNTRYVTSIIVITCFLVNFVVLINNAEPVPIIRKNEIRNRTYTCYEPKDFFVIWDIVHIVLYSLLPFTIILSENAFLMFLARKHVRRMRNASNITSNTITKRENNDTSDEPAMSGFIDRLSQRLDKRKRVYRKNVDLRTINKRSTTSFSPTRATSKDFVKTDKTLKIHERRNKKMKSKGSHVTRLLMFLTVSFFFTTVPYSLFYALKLNIEMDQNTRNIVVGVLALLQYLRHSGNFLIYLVTSSLIKNEIKAIFQTVLRYFISSSNRL